MGKRELPLGRKKMYQVVKMDEPHFGEGELARTEFVVEDDDASHIPMMLANTTFRTIWVHKRIYVRLYQL